MLYCIVLYCIVIYIYKAHSPGNLNRLHYNMYLNVPSLSDPEVLLNNLFHGMLQSNNTSEKTENKISDRVSDDMPPTKKV